MSTSSYVGCVIAGRFEVTCALGEGAGGTVWVAHDRQFGIPVALKLLRSSLRPSALQRAAFEREARLCARMLSPHIVRLLAFGVDEAAGLPYIAYELLLGNSLDERLRGGPLAIDEIASVIVHVARGLSRAHTLGVVHRDIKPSNVFVTLDDRDKPLAKLLDFGVAQLRERDTVDDDGVCGTLEYMAPEVVLRDGAASEAADLYALTAVAYECLTGRPPFAVASLHDIVIRIALGPREPPSVVEIVGERAAVALDAWFAKGLALDPSARFVSASELATELQTLVASVRPSVATRARDDVPTVGAIHARLVAGKSIAALRPPVPRLEREARMAGGLTGLRRGTPSPSRP